MFLVLQVGSSICPHLSNPNDVEYVIIYKDIYDYVKVANKYKKKNTSVWGYQEDEYISFLQTIHIWDYQIKFFKILEGEISNFPLIEKFFKDFSILDEKWLQKYKEYYKNKIIEYQDKRRTKILYHCFFTMYITKNNNYFHFSKHQQEIINLSHNKEKIPEQDLQELQNFMFSN